MCKMMQHQSKLLYQTFLFQEAQFSLWLNRSGIQKTQRGTGRIRAVHGIEKL